MTGVTCHGAIPAPGAPPSRRPLVAIDGPGGSGKSTVARLLADRLGIARLDTGAMYRAVTLRALERGVSPEDPEAVTGIADKIELDLDDPERVLVDDEDVTAAIRGPAVDAAVSAVAAIPAVRSALVRRQQEWIARHDGAVVEGRDIGAVVAPEADLKVYLTASVAERAQRRAGERRDGATEVEAAMRRRDTIDSSRAVSPLAVAPGAIIVDSTGRPVEAVVEELVDRLRRLGEQRAGRSDAVGPATPSSTAPPVARTVAGLVAGRPINPWELRFYAACRFVVVGLGNLAYPGPLIGAERLPVSGPYILAPVHRSNLDWMIVARVTRRRLRYLVKSEVWKIRVLGRLADLLGAFPVRRGAADREAMATALSALAGGEPLVVFPEGTRRSGDRVVEVRDGSAYLALRAGVPIVPVGLAGTEQAMPRGARLPRPARVAIVIGQPIRPPARAGTAGRGDRALAETSVRAGHVSRSALRATTEALVSAMQQCFDEARAQLGSKD